MTHDLPPLPADIAAIRDALKFTNGIGKPQPSLYYAECTPERIARLLDALEQAQKDAERYRKWRADYTGGRITDMLIDISDAATPDEVDAAIDAAMKGDS